jgi:hypothetical protein
MKSNDIKVLEFREELMKLLNKYKYEIQGSAFDDGSMRIETENNCYLLSDSYSIQK